MIRVFFAAACLLSAAGCAGGPDTTPSLLPRAAEGHAFDAPAVTPVAAVTPDPALDARIAELVAQRRAASAAFAKADAALAPQLRSAARAPVGSDAWLDAQTALATLDAERATLLGVLSAIEQLAIARAAEGALPYPALDVARVDTDAELDRVAAVVAARKAALPL